MQELSKFIEHVVIYIFMCGVIALGMLMSTREYRQNPGLVFLSFVLGVGVGYGCEQIARFEDWSFLFALATTFITPVIHRTVTNAKDISELKDQISGLNPFSKKKPPSE